MQLELNKKYLNHDGDVVEICTHLRGSYPWVDADGRSYKDNGRCDFHPRPQDLMSEVTQESTTKPHVHAELIKAWADGVVIEYYDDAWLTWSSQFGPTWNPTAKYRIKPEVKPNYFKFGKLASNYTCIGWSDTPHPCDNIQAEFSGETNELISVKLIKDTYENRAY